MKNEQWLKKFLNVYWLRPENALWRANNCVAMDGITFKPPSLDLSCGDGVFSFLRAGGDFDIDFDIFGSVENLNAFFENEDIYNTSNQTYDPKITTEPEYTVTVGTDWKQPLLEKANTLGFYDKLIKHDNNKKLPFDDGQFNTVFSNSVYWVDNLDLHLKEISRVTKSEGKAILILKTKYVNSLLNDMWEYEDQLGTTVIEMINRGRSSNYAHKYTDKEWTRRLEKAVLEVLNRHTTNTQFHSYMADIGLRPISPHLIKMAYSLPVEQRVEIKKDWIDTWQDLLNPFVDPAFDIDERPPVEIVYEVTPS